MNFRWSLSVRGPKKPLAFRLQPFFESSEFCKFVTSINMTAEWMNENIVRIVVRMHGQKQPQLYTEIESSPQQQRSSQFIYFKTCSMFTKKIYIIFNIIYIIIMSSKLFKWNELRILFVFSFWVRNARSVLIQFEIKPNYAIGPMNDFNFFSSIDQPANSITSKRFAIRKLFKLPEYSDCCVDNVRIDFWGQSVNCSIEKEKHFEIWYCLICECIRWNFFNRVELDMCKRSSSETRFCDFLVNVSMTWNDDIFMSNTTHTKIRQFSND